MNNATNTETNAPVARVSLASLFVPKTETKKKGKNNKESEVNAFAIEIFSKMIKELEKGSLECFDAHTQDFGCERVALKIYLLMNNNGEMKKRLIELGKEISASAQQIMLDENECFLLRCYFLRLFRKVNKKGKFEISQGTLEKSIYSKKAFTQIVRLFQSKVSEMSMDCMNREAKILFSNQTIPFEPQPKKCIASSYFSVKLLTLKLAQMQAPILVKKMAEEGEKTFGILLRSSFAGAEFESIDRSEISENTSLIVIEGDVREGVSVEELKMTLTCTYKFTKYLRLIGACCEQILPNDPEVVKEQKKAFKKGCVSKGVPREEMVLIDSGGKKTKVYEPIEEAIKKLANRLSLTPPTEQLVFDLDHVYCSTLAEEQVNGADIYGK